MLLVGRQEGHPACKKTEWSDFGVVIFLGWGADLHMAELIPLPLTLSCCSKVPAYLCSPGQIAVKWVLLSQVTLIGAREIQAIYTPSGFPFTGKPGKLLGNSWNFMLVDLCRCWHSNSYTAYKLIRVTKEWMVNINDECLVCYIFWLLISRHSF